MNAAEDERPLDAFRAATRGDGARVEMLHRAYAMLRLFRGPEDAFAQVCADFGVRLADGVRREA